MRPIIAMKTNAPVIFLHNDSLPVLDLARTILHNSLMGLIIAIVQRMVPYIGS